MSLNPEQRLGNDCIDEISSEYRQPEAVVYQTGDELKWDSIEQESFPSIYFTLDSTGVVLAVNPVGAAGLGYTVEELTSQPIFSIFHPEDQARLQVEFASFAEYPAQVVKGKFRLLSKDNSSLLVKVTAQALQGVDAKTVFLLTAKRITEHQSLKTGSQECQPRQTIGANNCYISNSPLEAGLPISMQESENVGKPAPTKSEIHKTKWYYFTWAVVLFDLFQKVLKTGELQRDEPEIPQLNGDRDDEGNEEKFRLLFSNELDAIILVDIETGQLLDVNQAFVDLYGYSREEALSMTVANVRAQQANLEATIKQANLEGKAHIYLGWHKKKDGTVFPVELCVKSFIWKGRRVMCAVVRDITERQRAEEELRQSEERLRWVLQNMPVMMDAFDANWNIIIWNRECERVTGYQSQEIVGNPKAMELLYPNPDYRQQMMATWAERGHDYRDWEWEITCKDGSVKVISWSNISQRYPIPGWATWGVGVDVTDRKRAETVLRQQFQREQLVAAIAQRIHQSLNLEEILNTTVAEVRQFLATDRVLIYRLSPNGSGSAVTEAVVPGWPTILGQTFPEEVFPQESQQFYRQGRILAIADVEKANILPCLVEFVQQFGVRAQLVVPILQEEALWGLLIAHQCSCTRQWQPLEIDWLKQLATQLAIAIQQSELYKQTQHQAHREQALNRVIQSIRNSLDLKSIFSTATFEITNLLQADRAEIVQYLPEQKLWVNVADYRKTPDLPSALGLEIPDEDNEIAARLKRLEVIRIDNASTCEDEINRGFAQRFPGAWLLVPLHFGSSIWGSLSVITDKPQSSWQDSEVELTCAVADQVAIAIQQSELFRIVQRLNANLERQVQARTAELQLASEFEATLKRITDRVRDSLDEGQILQTAVQELATAIRVKGCNAALYDLDQGTSTIYYEYTTSVAPSKGREAQMAAFPEIYAQLLQGQCFQFCSIFPNPVRGHVAMLACPIVDDQGVLGDLWLIHHSYYAFHEQDIRLVQQVANQCAIAIRQARLFQAAQAQVEELEKLNRLKDHFLSTVSHELRTPISNIKMATQMLEIVLKQAGIFDAESNKALRYFQILNDECHREISLINDLLDLSRLEAGTEPLMLTTIEPQIWIPSIAEPFIERAREQQQQFQVDIQSELPPLTTDLSDLERILTELLNNACKYTPAGGIITVSANATVRSLQLRVSNSGIEIPARELPHIFDKFYRIPNHDPWKHAGTGLGLALVKKLVEHLGGTIQAESSHGQTTFILQFPIKSLPFG